MIIDVHCHYALVRRPADPALERFSFEPAHTAAGEQFDSCVSPRCLRRPSWRLARRALGLAAREPAALDSELQRFYERHLLASGPVQRIVLLAFDRYHYDDGRAADWPQRAGVPGSDIYTSNTLIRALCRRHPQRFLFGASVHPYRPQAPALIDEVFAAGACLLKWIPLHQNIDVFDPRTRAVMRRCAELGLALLVHYNGEFTLATNHPGYVSIGPLLEVLRQLRREGNMPTTIVAHVATPPTPWGRRDDFEALLAALAGEFADAPLYADISALASWGKVGFLRRLAARPELHGKLLLGSDFPVPAGLPRLRRDLGDRYHAIRAQGSWIQQAAQIYRQVGFCEIVLHRAAQVLPNVDFFARQAASATSGSGAG